MYTLHPKSKTSHYTVFFGKAFYMLVVTQHKVCPQEWIDLFICKPETSVCSRNTILVSSSTSPSQSASLIEAIYCQLALDN